MPSIRHLVRLLPIVFLQSCREATTLRAPKSLEELAAGWSAGRTDPTCQKRGPRGEYLGTLPGAEYCQWPTVARGAEWSTVGGHRNSLVGLSDLVWERRVRGDAAVSRLADSLSKELLAQGLRERRCLRGGRRWETDNLGVELTRIPARADGMSIVTVFATSIPKAIPNLFCPTEPTSKPLAN